MLSTDLVRFLVRAKKNTYAAGIAPTGSSGPGSHDLFYDEEPYLYIDTYLGGFHFIGEEAVWESGTAAWGMNYYGRMVRKDIPEGFSPFLKAALLQVPEARPFRGPEKFSDDGFVYRCSSEGSLTQFNGEEEILLNGDLVYKLMFHGGEIKT